VASVAVAVTTTLRIRRFFTYARALQRDRRTASVIGHMQQRLSSELHARLLKQHGD
jgi:hypothetical protein